MRNWAVEGCRVSESTSTYNSKSGTQSCNAVKLCAKYHPLGVCVVLKAGIGDQPPAKSKGAHVFRWLIHHHWIP